MAPIEIKVTSDGIRSLALESDHEEMFIEQVENNTDYVHTVRVDRKEGAQLLAALVKWLKVRKR